MRFLLLTILLVCFSLTIFSQTEEKVFPLSALKLEKGEKLVEQKFPNVPQEVKNIHARGNIRYLVVIDKEGRVKKLTNISELSKTINNYLEKTIINWQFKPLKLEGKDVVYRAVIVIPFCYGSFSRCSY